MVSFDHPQPGSTLLHADPTSLPGQALLPATHDQPLLGSSPLSHPLLLLSPLQLLHLPPLRPSRHQQPLPLQLGVEGADSADFLRPAEDRRLSREVYPPNQALPTSSFFRLLRLMCQQLIRTQVGLCEMKLKMRYFYGLV